MSADNYLAVRYNKDSVNKPWEVLMGNASTGHETRWSGFSTRNQAIDKAMDIQNSEMVEYGISLIEKEPADE